MALHSFSQNPFWEEIDIPDEIKRLNCISVNDSGHLFLGASPYDGYGGGVYRLKGEGFEWEHLTNTKSIINSIALSQTGDIFVGNGPRLMRSIDNGVSWDSLKYMVTHYDDIVVTEDSMVFATTYYGLLRSFDYGDSWDMVFDEQIGDAWMSSVCVGPNKELYIGLRDYYDPVRGVYRSLDTGNTWEYFKPYQPIHSVAARQNGNVYAGCLYHGFYRRLPNDTIWKLLISNITVEDILIQEYGHIYLAAEGYGVIRYDEITQSYSSHNSGIELSSYYITDLASDPDGFLYCLNTSIHNSRVYKSTSSVITDIKPDIVPRNILISCYPNPFRSETTIKINITSDDPCTEILVNVYNTAGNQVKEFKLDNADTFTLSDDLPVGVYYIVVQSGGFRGCCKIIRIE